jgi:hypothetical protein
MRSVSVRRIVVAAFWLVGSLCGASGANPNPGKRVPPKLMLWSWYAADDFRPLADTGVGVAYLALSLRFDGQSEVTPDPRMIPVRIAPGTYQMAVVRFNYYTNAAHRPAFSPRQRQLAVRMVAEIAAFTRPQAVQIDFDAPRSAWPFYRQLLADIRDRLGPDMFLSVTALVSWCDTAQSWLAGLPVDEIVPMAFYMGRATPAVVTMLQRGGQFAFPGCRESIGVGLDNEYYGQPSARPRNGQRAYFFPGSMPWSPEAVKVARKVILP